MATATLRKMNSSRTEPAPAYRNLPSKLFLEPTTRCNLKCRMCVKQTGDCAIDEGDMPLSLVQSLLPLLPTLDSVIISGIGEPLLHPGLMDMIDFLSRHRGADMRIGLQTNGTLLGAPMARKLVDSGLDKICISMDAINPEKFSSIRKGARMDTVADAYRNLAAARQRTGADHFRIGAEYVLMAQNLSDLPAAVSHMATLGVDFLIVTQLIPYDSTHTDQVAYGTNTDASREFFQAWKRKAERNGIDLNRYYEALRRFYKARSPYERKLYDTVERMQIEARELGIPLDIRALIDEDPARLERVAGIFEEAARNAAGAGIELHLPAFEAKKERRCAFVEEGGAFVNWRGEVHPCYFTWHQYACYINDRKKYVQPKVFGDLSADSMNAIWNRADFRGFRERVLSYEYPYCGNCTFAPCDYIGTDTFTHDCHTLDVPCGDCPWCDGLLQCLQ